MPQNRKKKNTAQHAVVWRDSIICVLWLIHMLWRGSYTYATHLHICDTFTYVTHLHMWLVYICIVTHSYVVTWLICICEVVCLSIDSMWHFHICDSFTYVTHLHIYRDSFTIHMYRDSLYLCIVTRYICITNHMYCDSVYICIETHSRLHMYRDSLYICIVTRYICITNHMYHDSVYICIVTHIRLHMYRDEGTGTWPDYLVNRVLTKNEGPYLKKIVRNSRNSCRKNSGVVGAHGQLTRSSNRVSPETNTNAQRILLMFTSIALTLVPLGTKLLELPAQFLTGSPGTLIVTQFTYVSWLTWLVYICTVTHTYVSWLIHMFWRDSFAYVTWFVCALTL